MEAMLKHEINRLVELTDTNADEILIKKCQSNIEYYEDKLGKSL